MKTRQSPACAGRPFQAAMLASLCLVASSAVAQMAPPGYTSSPPLPGSGYVPPSQQHAYTPQAPPPGYAPPAEYRTEYVSPMEFLPTVGRRFGQMFRRVFYGDDPQAYHSYPQQGRPGHSLDSAPPSYQSHYGQPSYPEGYAQPPQSYQPPPSGYPSQSLPTPQPQYQPPPSQPQYQRPPQDPRSLPGGINTPPASTSRPAPSSVPAPQAKRSEPKVQESPPKKYIPPTLTKKPAPKLEETAPPPPPQVTKKTNEATTNDHFPLPGNKPSTNTSGENKTPTANSSTSSTAATQSSPSPSPKPASNNGGFLKGKKTGKEGRVVSPYPPYQELDVTGLSSGSLALDPTTQKVFEVP